MTSGPQAETTAHFQPTPASARSARRFVCAALESWDLGALEEVAALLVSELMTNVVLHARTDADVRVRQSGEGVRVEVHDRDPRLPTRKRYSDDATTGRGLGVVQKLSARWGSEPTAGGKVVWFELSEGQSAGHGAGLWDVDLDVDEWDDLATGFAVGPGARPSPEPPPGPSPGRARSLLRARLAGAPW